MGSFLQCDNEVVLFGPLAPASGADAGPVSHAVHVVLRLSLHQHELGPVGEGGGGCGGGEHGGGGVCKLSLHHRWVCRYHLKYQIAITIIFGLTFYHILM